MANIEISGLPGFTALATLNEKTEPYLTTARSNSSISIIPHNNESPCSRGCGDNCTSCYNECASAFASCKAKGEDIRDCRSDHMDCIYECCLPPPLP